MKNKVVKEYLDTQMNIQDNYEEILKKVKKQHQSRLPKRLVQIAATFLVVALLGTVSNQLYARIKWSIEFKEYENRAFEYGKGSVKEAVDDGYNENIEMEYVEQDGISAKIDSIMVTDDYMRIQVNFVFDDAIKVDSERFSYGIAVYDENNNIYGIFTRMHIGIKEQSKYDRYWEYIYKELGVEYDKKDIYSIQYKDSCGLRNYSCK